VNECAKVCLAIRQQGTELTPFSSLPCIEVLDRRFGCGFESRPARSDKKTLLQIAGSSTKVEQIACYLFYKVQIFYLLMTARRSVSGDMQSGHVVGKLRDYRKSISERISICTSIFLLLQ